jgi:hypothetical protein
MRFSNATPAMGLILSLSKDEDYAQGLRLGPHGAKWRYFQDTERPI